MKKYLFILTAILFLLPGFAVAQENPDFSLEKIFYLPKYNAVRGVESLSKNWEKIDILAPQYHVVNSDLTVSGDFGPKLRALIKEHNLKVMPLIANSNFSRTTIHNLLISPRAQDYVINYLIRGALTNGYIGWQFDFENISYQDKDLYTAFVEKANSLFRENNLVFSVVVVARTTDFEDSYGFRNWSGVYDYKAIAENCDFVSLMAYDDPNSVGPTASLPFVIQAVDYAKDKIPAEKLSLGIPLYYWQWDVDSTKRIKSGLYVSVVYIKSILPHASGFDWSLGSGWIAYYYNNRHYKIWFEDKISFNLKLAVANLNNLRGFSAWLLGGEDPEIWSIL